jgi:DegV family protein with EDD domain
VANVGLVTDSTCDLSPDDLALLGVEMVPLTVHFGDDHYRDWIDIEPTDFYRRLAAARQLPTTSQPSPADFSAAFDRLAQQGRDSVVVLTISSGLSGTYQSASIAAMDAPIPVHVVDTRRASLAVALLVQAAAEARDSGKDAVAIEALCGRLASSSRLYFLLDTLEYLVKGGRAGRAAGLAASLLDIKPVLDVNADGVVEPFKKVRGRQQALGALVTHVAEDVAKLGAVRMAVLHGADEARSAQLEAALRESVPNAEIVLNGIIGPVIGTYTGPGALGVAYYPTS